MVPLDLTDRERELLVEILEADLSDLRAEIAQTERLAFRAMLKERREVLERTIQALGSPAALPG
jgi:hypothetical protein